MASKLISCGFDDRYTRLSIESRRIVRRKEECFLLIRARLYARVACAVLLAASLVPSVAAQDALYWTEQFGNRARLLGGAVVGSARDLSATYYNPGGLALVPAAEILLAGNVFTYTRYDATSPSGRKLSSPSLILSPSLFAGEIPSQVVGNHRVAYSFLNRQNAKLRLKDRGNTSEDSPGFPDLRLLADNVQIEQSLSENWFGVTWSYKVAERVGFGVTTYFATRNQSIQFLKFSQALGENGRAGAAIQNREFSYNNYGLLWKIGLATRSEGWGFGVTVTTPRVSFAGSGATGFDSTAVGQDIDGNGNAITEVATNTQGGLAADFQSLFSIAVGGAIGLGSAKLHVTSEWFASVDELVILPSEPFVGQSSGELIDTAISRELTDVLNVAVGFENRFNEKVIAYGSFSTDRSGFAKSSEASVPIGDWDLYHVAAGTTFKFGRSEVTTGAIVSFGDSTSGQVFEPVDVELAEGDGVKVDYFRLALLVGFNFAFN